MKRTLILFSALVMTFCLGYAFNSKVNNNTYQMKRVTGIGGVFFKSKEPKKLTEWYERHLGLKTNPYGATFEWYETPDSNSKAQTQWTPFAENSRYFDKEFMINYRVENLESLVVELKKEGVKVLDEIETYDYGKFVHIEDLEGNKIELWEPVD